jgi:DivIVA domain-containing protein
MDSPDQSILETLRMVQFRFGLKGYNFEDVDKFLEKVAAEAESVLEQLRTANERLRHANEWIGELEAELQRATEERAPEPSAGVTEDALQKTFILAQKFVEQTKRESEEEALEILIRAEERGSALVAQAEERARQIVTESEDRLREEIARLESQRSRLASEVETMSEHLNEQRTQVRESVTEVLEWIDVRLPASLAPVNGPDRGGASAEVERGHAPTDASASVGNGLRPQQRRPGHNHRSPGRKRPS